MLTMKQFGDAGEHYVLALLAFNGMPVAKMPDGWPVYDCIAQPAGTPQRITVKTTSLDAAKQSFFVDKSDGWDWLAVVGVKAGDRARVWLIPRETVEREASICQSARSPSGKGIVIAHYLLREGWAVFENNWTLDPLGDPSLAPTVVPLLTPGRKAGLTKRANGTASASACQAHATRRLRLAA